MLYLSISEKYDFTVYTKLIYVVLLIFWLPLLLKGTDCLIHGGGGLNSWKSQQISYLYCYVTLNIFLRKLATTIYTDTQYQNQVKFITYSTVQTVFKIVPNFKIMHNFYLQRWRNYYHIHFLHTLEQTVAVKRIRKPVPHNVLHKDRGIICSVFSFFAVCL